MTRYTIKKMEQSVNSSFMKQGMTFYRVKADGVYVRDFRSKFMAKEKISRLKSKKK